MVFIISKLKALNNISLLSSVLAKEKSNEMVGKSCPRVVMFLNYEHLGLNSIKKIELAIEYLDAY